MEQYKKSVYCQYKDQIGGIGIPVSWWGSSPFRFIESEEEVSKKQLGDLVRKEGGENEVYKICLNKRITWLEYFGIRKKSEEEKKEEAELFKDWTF